MKSDKQTKPSILVEYNSKVDGKNMQPVIPWESFAYDMANSKNNYTK